MKKQLQGVIDSRAEVVKSMSIMSEATELIIQRVAFNCQSETYASGDDERRGGSYSREQADFGGIGAGITLPFPCMDMRSIK